MFAIYVPTIYAFTTLVSASLGGLLMWLWRRDPTQPALAYWGATRILGALTLPFLAARGFIPDWISIDLANGMMGVVFGLIWAGARQFEGRPAKPLPVLAGAAVWLIACRVPAFHASVAARTALINGILGAYNLAAALEFQRGRTMSPLPSRPVMIILLTFTAAVYFACGVFPFWLPVGQPGQALPTALWFGLLSCIAVVLMAGSTILLVALTKEQAELLSTSALKAARDLATEASTQKTHFLARMSHELRTPLNGVLGLAQVLSNDPELGERQRRQAATLEHAGRHLLAILNEVLDLSRIEAGRLELPARSVVLVEFLRDTVAMVDDTALANGLALTLDLAPGLPECVMANPMRLRQILLNLLNNALKFTPTGGRVLLAVAGDSGNRLRFTVIDTGPGVPEALRPRLFQDYAQGLGDHAPGGGGLGLAISARLAHAMGGDLAHANGPGGVGSRFTLVVPLPAVAQPAAVPAVPPASRPLIPPNGLRILVVDDVALNRMTARAMLEHAGHVVDVAEDGPAALAAMARAPLPDIILMDQSMPGMDGYMAARHIRSMAGPAGRLPILAVTANALPEDIAASLAAGMDGHVSKPIELKALLAAIAAVLHRTR